MNTLRKINNALKKAELWIGTIALIAIFVLITVNIIKRYFFNNAWGWAGELNGFIYAWIAFIAAGYSMAEDSHVRIAIIDQKFGVKAAQYVRVVTDLITIFAFVWLSIPTINAIGGMRYTAALRWPKGIVYSGLLVGYALYIIHSVLQIFRRIYWIKTDVDIFSEQAPAPPNPSV